MNDTAMLQMLRRELAARASAADAAVLRRFFKTGPGDYAAGDHFRGVRMPALRALAARFEGRSLTGARRLLASPLHEDRALALLLLMRRFARGDAAAQRRIFKLYRRSTRWINNWDLVDLSAPAIVGAWTAAHGIQPLRALMRSPLLWERRIAMVATLWLIRRGRLAPTFELARRCLRDREELMHKAAGWMLREAGKRDAAALRRFLTRHGAAMPRLMWRYATERLRHPPRPNV
jgi:3-methyladenine DNA glycosylase AlkD